MKYTIKNANIVGEVSPNYVYNRYDLQANIKYIVLQYQDKNETHCVEYKFVSDSRVQLGISLSNFSPKVIRRIANHIFKTNKNVESIEYNNSLNPYDKSLKHNHFRIELPKTIEELSRRQNQKSRYNLRRDIRLLEEQCGEIKFIRVDASSKEAKGFMDFYFKKKYESHKTEYGLDYLTYVEKYFTTDIYAMTIGDKIISILLSCEQCPIVYLENLTYDNDFAKYSTGIILYDYFIKEMIKKGKEQIFLLGGNYEYKRRYGSIEEVVYSGEILRKWPSFCLTLKKNTKKFVEFVVPRNAYRFMTKKLHRLLHIKET